MEVKHINEKEFDDEVLKSDKKVLVDFFATWCGPCNMMAPVLEEIASEHDEFKIVKVDVDKNENLAYKYKIMSIPAFFVFDKGEVATKAVGAMSKSEVLEMLS